MVFSRYLVFKIVSCLAAAKNEEHWLGICAKVVGKLVVASTKRLQTQNVGILKNDCS